MLLYIKTIFIFGSYEVKHFLYTNTREYVFLILLYPDKLDTFKHLKYATP